MDIAALLTYTVQENASDLHLSVGHSPRLRVQGDLIALDLPPLKQEDLLGQLSRLMNKQQQEQYQKKLETDFSYRMDKLASFRVHAFTQCKGAAAVFRVIPPQIPSLADLDLPAQLTAFTQYSSGLVLVTGPTGSGKSTTLAALIDHLNTSTKQHIITLEDPIEFTHQSKQCLINQREIGRDTLSFTAALRAALREDPDVICIGELRDTETIRLALTAAETGHLVFASLHTNSATKTINRLIHAFPAEEKALIRLQLSQSLQAVIAQILVKTRQGDRRAALEILVCTPAIRNLIREDKIAQMYSTLQTGQAYGMQTLDQHLSELVANNCIDKHRASQLAQNKDLF